MIRRPTVQGTLGVTLVAAMAAMVLTLALAAGAQTGEENQITAPANPTPKTIVSQDDKDKSKAKPKPDFPPFTTVMAGFTGPYQGLYPIYENKKKNQLYAVIPSSQMNRPFLLATSFAGGTTFAGWQWNDYLLYWKPAGKQLLLMEKNVHYTPGKLSPEVREVVARTYTDRVFMTVPIRTQGGGGFVIDLGQLLSGSSSRFFGRMGQGNASLAKYSFKSFKLNLEAEVEMPGPGGQFVKLHYSIADVNSLSSSNYKKRLADDRVGYFITAVKDFSSTDDPERFVRYVNRWHLEKRDPKLTMSPPKKPIVFYIEKTVPVKYRRYVREGLELWNKAFAKCGFINAIEVRQQESFNEFADLDPEDMRYNFFRWITSERAFAMGPSRVNPMTGEIIDADIILDDSMVQGYLREYDQMIRDLNKDQSTPEMQAYYRARPHRHPDRVLGGAFLEQLHRNRDRTDAPEPVGLKGAPDLHRHTCGSGDYMNRCCERSFGRGKAQELAVASLYFAMLGDENAKKDDDKKKEEKKDKDKDKENDKDKKEKKEKKEPFPEEFMGQVIREIVCHEVGHTLGLRHNFKGSTYRTLSEINSTDKPGDTTGSVMDYNPVNVAVDRPQGYWAPVELGPYDFWAIEYGYKPVRSTKELTAIAQRGAEKGLDYGTDEDVGRGDPYINRFDAGADPLAYARTRLAFVHKLRKNLTDRTVKKGEGYQNLRRAFDTLLFEIAGASGLAVQFVGGHRIHRDHRGQPEARDPVVPVPAVKQREGLTFLCENIFTDKLFTFPPDLLRKLAEPRWSHWGARPGFNLAYPLHQRVLRIQNQSLAYLLNPVVLRRIYDIEQLVDGQQDCLTLVELFDTLENAIWSELADGPRNPSSERKPYISSIRRNLQRYYLEELTDIALEPNASWMPSTVRTLARHHVKQLKKKVDEFLASHGSRLDTYTRSHLDECSTLLGKTLQAAFQLGGTGGGSPFFFF